MIDGMSCNRLGIRSQAGSAEGTGTGRSLNVRRQGAMIWIWTLLDGRGFRIWGGLGLVCVVLCIVSEALCAERRRPALQSRT